MEHAARGEDGLRGEVARIAVRQLARSATAIGIAQHDMPPLLRASSAGVSLEAFVLAWEALVQRTAEPSLAVLLAEQATIEDYELLGYLVAACGTVAEALAVLVEHGDLWMTGLSWELASSERKVTLRLRFDAERSVRSPARARLGVRCVVESMLAVVLRLLRIVTGTPLAPVLVRFAHSERDSADAHRRYFGAPTVFGSTEDALVFDPGVVDSTIPTGAAIPGLRSVLEAHASIRRSSAPTAKRTSDHVREILLAHAMAEGARFRPEEVASRLGWSERSLRRRLDREGTSFRALYDEVLCARARAALDRGESVEVLARRLGFEGRSAFARAFRRWTGLSPREYRSSTTLRAGPGRAASRD